jgi:penicillin-binding protein 1C
MIKFIKKIFTLAVRYPKISLITLLIMLFLYWFCLPSKLFERAVCTVLFDKEGRLLGAKIAADGQWRFPPADSVPIKFERCLLTFEDKRFHSHWGVDVTALGRAFWQNISSSQRISGASTITMQVMRLHYENSTRSYWQKVKEIVLATRVEWTYSKKQILEMYASNAPFGANVVGLDAAAWKYYGRAAAQLTWAESATLAVLPNNPSIIHISKNRDLLKQKRDKLLQKLCSNGDLDSISCALAMLEPLPTAPKQLPMLAYHLLERLHQSYNSNTQQQSKYAENRLKTTFNSFINADIQIQVNDILTRSYPNLAGNGIHNAAAVVVEVATNNVVAYVGNIPQANPNADKEHGWAVDMIPANRSSGSILKPFLYAAMLHDGEMMPHTLYPDVPTFFGSYSPKNFDEHYAGAVAANEMIEKSLNIPSVYMLNQYGTTRFLHKLQSLGMRTLKKSAEHYGLTLILGGAEVRLEDLAAMYAGMVRELNGYCANNSSYYNNNYQPINYIYNSKTAYNSFYKDNNNLPNSQTNGTKGSQADKLELMQQTNSPLSAAAIWHTLNAMQEVARPNEDNHWRNFLSSSRVAWKTGTSFGFRDAWAVGCTPKYVVAVWVGNADGEGRAGLLGVRAAAPILFDIFSSLGNNKSWFPTPYDDLVKVATCRLSGAVASNLCKDVDTVLAPTSCIHSAQCKYHKEYFLSADQQYQVHSQCEIVSNMRKDTFFTLPPSQDWYYRKRHIVEKSLPPYRTDCQAMLPAKNVMSFIYPNQQGLKIYIPTNLDEQRSKVVFEIAHSRPQTLIHWHLDNEYISSTAEIHQLSLNPTVGQHIITAVDADGERLSRNFQILDK